MMRVTRVNRPLQQPSAERDSLEGFQACRSFLATYRLSASSLYSESALLCAWGFSKTQVQDRWQEDSANMILDVFKVPG